MSSGILAPKTGVSRRTFVSSVVAAGAGLAVAPRLWAQTLPATTQSAVEPINVAIVGVGKQGSILLELALKLPGVRLTAVCDIWSYTRQGGEGLCRSAKHTAKSYDDYRTMLSEEKNLDAVIVATSDIWHAPITNDCLRAGKHVYCEKEMSNTLEGAASMVRTARETKKLLQIGHQRRSNPYYKHAMHLVQNDKFCGDIYAVNGQWNQFKPLRGVPDVLLKRYPMSPTVLEKWGFGSFVEFLEWRWFKKYAGGPMTDLGSHQIDIFNWFLKSYPSSVHAVGKMERALAEAKAKDVGYTPECFDSTFAMYEWKLPTHSVTGYYQVNLNSTFNLFSEQFQGTGGSIQVSELRDTHWNAIFKEPTVEPSEWEKAADKVDRGGQRVMEFKPGKSQDLLKMLGDQKIPLETFLAKKPHEWHLENFFNSIRGKETLNCTAEDAYATAVSVIKANESALTGKRIEFKPDDFRV